MDLLATRICCGGCPFHRSNYNSQEGCIPVSASSTIISSRLLCFYFKFTYIIVSPYCYKLHRKEVDTISFGNLFVNSCIQKLDFVTRSPPPPPQVLSRRNVARTLMDASGKGAYIRQAPPILFDLYYLVNFHNLYVH